MPRRDQRVWFGDGESEYLYDRALECLGETAEIVEIDLAPLQEAAQLLYSGPWVAERTAAHGRPARERSRRDRRDGAHGGGARRGP